MLETKTIKQRIEELNTLQDDLITSDLQGVCGAIALNINKLKYVGYAFEVENILLSYAYNEITLEECLKECGL